MANDASINQMAEALKKGFDTSDDAPTPSLTPDTKQTVVRGNPNEIKKRDIEPYKLVFNYSPDEIKEEDKENMVYIEKTDEWAVGVSYSNLRVKPLHRTKVAAMFLDICVAIGVVAESGITKSKINEATAMALLDQTDNLAQLAMMVCGLTPEQASHLNPGCLFDFFLTLLHNEPNLQHEGNNFLSYSDYQEKMSSQAKK